VPQALQTILEFLEERAAIEIKSVNAAVRGNKDWALKFDLLQTIPGIAAKSALAILGELVVLQPHTSARALIAYSGLDPQNSKSGNAEHEAKISRGGSVHLRRALYMPAVTAIRCNFYFKRFFKKLVKRGKHRNVAIIAAERKMLQGIYGMLKTGTRFNGKKLFGKTVGKTSQPAQKKSSS
jgi:transposase